MAFIQFFQNCSIILRMFIFKTQVFEFRFNFIQSQSIRNRCKDIKCFSCNFILFRWQHTRQRAHIVQAVRYFNQNHTYVIAHHEQEFFERLSLQRSSVSKDTPRNFRYPFNDIRNFRTKQVTKVLVCIVRVLLHVV